MQILKQFTEAFLFCKEKHWESCLWICLRLQYRYTYLPLLVGKQGEKNTDLGQSHDYKARILSEVPEDQASLASVGILRKQWESS